MLVVTGDGSPTLAPGTAGVPEAPGSPADERRGELMHHRGGALSESVHVYGPAIELAWQQAATTPGASLSHVRFGVVGLGLGYLERLCLALGPHVASQPHDRAGKGASLPQPEAGLQLQASIDSYESDPMLRQRFERWLNGKAEPWHDEVSAAFARAGLENPPGSLQNQLSELAGRGELSLKEALGAPVVQGTPTLGPLCRYHAILFDPYSRATSPVLWDPDFLSGFLAACANPHFCVFATYASRTVLREVLEQAGFTVTRRKGFHGKRECTLALRAKS